MFLHSVDTLYVILTILGLFLLTDHLYIFSLFYLFIVILYYFVTRWYKSLDFFIYVFVYSRCVCLYLYLYFILFIYTEIGFKYSVHFSMCIKFYTDFQLGRFNSMNCLTELSLWPSDDFLFTVVKYKDGRYCFSNKSMCLICFSKYNIAEKLTMHDAPSWDNILSNTVCIWNTLDRSCCRFNTSLP